MIVARDDLGSAPNGMLRERDPLGKVLLEDEAELALLA